MNFNKNLILASQSPRRQQLLADLGFVFEIKLKNVEEIFPQQLVAQEIPLYLANLKADAFDGEINDSTVVLTADTIVWIDNKVLNKPKDEQEARAMLQLLSGKMHQVFTGVCLKTKYQKIQFYCETKVYFKQLTDQEIDFYIAKYKPFDKAGAYGAQEWMGLIGIDRIEGSYFNVMGLPTKEVYEALLAIK